MTKYLLKERNDKSTKTLHIYEGIDDMKVICGSDSLTSVEFKDYLKTRSLEDMRIHIAKIAHTTNICSICISHLYKNENKKSPFGISTSATKVNFVLIKKISTVAFANTALPSSTPKLPIYKRFAKSVPKRRIIESMFAVCASQESTKTAKTSKPHRPPPNFPQSTD